VPLLVNRHRLSGSEKPRQPPRVGEVHDQEIGLPDRLGEPAIGRTLGVILLSVAPAAKKLTGIGRRAEVHAQLFEGRELDRYLPARTAAVARVAAVPGSMEIEAPDRHQERRSIVVAWLRAAGLSRCIPELTITEVVDDRCADRGKRRDSRDVTPGLAIA
jgi:hypothetical protein